MAKLIKTDSSSQPTPVCGVPESSRDLPYKPGSSDSTKSVIDSKATVIDLGNIGVATKIVTFSNTCRMFVLSSGASTGRMGSWIVMGRASSVAYFAEIVSSSVVSLSSSENGKLVITSNGSNTYVQLLLLVGSEDDITIT